MRAGFHTSPLLFLVAYRKLMYFCTRNNKKSKSMIIKNVKFSYFNTKNQMGPYIDFIAELEVPSLDDDRIVNIIQNCHPEYEKVRVIRFIYK